MGPFLSAFSDLGEIPPHRHQKIINIFLINAEAFLVFSKPVTLCELQWIHTTSLPPVLMRIFIFIGRALELRQKRANGFEDYFGMKKKGALKGEAVPI